MNVQTASALIRQPALAKLHRNDADDPAEDATCAWYRGAGFDVFLTPRATHSTFPATLRPA